MRNRKKLVVLSGAGISAESGLQTFRDSDGLWMGHDIATVATPEGYATNPELVLQFYNMRRREVASAKPNPAHFALAAMEAEYDVTIITQNIDDLHERSGSTKVVHLHGEIFKMFSPASPNELIKIKGDIILGNCCGAEIQYRPFVVWFGEAVPMIDEAIKITRCADFFAVIGTSLQVYPAASLVEFVPLTSPVFIIDKKIPYLQSSANVIKIEMSATEGVPVFRNALKKYGSR